MDDGEAGEARTTTCKVGVVRARRERWHDRAHDDEVGEEW
jgi:hypothetical protein